MRIAAFETTQRSTKRLNRTKKYSEKLRKVSGDTVGLIHTFGVIAIVAGPSSNESGGVAITDARRVSSRNTVLRPFNREFDELHCDTTHVCEIELIQNYLKQTLL